jgi:hypothetical protein
MAWKYFACTGRDIDPVAASASINPVQTLSWVEREMKRAERRADAWVCRVYRVSGDMKAEAVSRYNKSFGLDQKVEIIHYKEAL